MNIIVLHGNDKGKLEDRISKFIKAANSRNIIVEKVNAKSDNIYDKLNASSIFEEEKLVVIENPKTLSKTSLEWITKNFNTLGITVVMFSTSVLSKTFISILPSERIVEEYSLPSILYKYLESFYPGNSDICIKLLHELINITPIEIVYTMLARHLKDLYWVKKDMKSVNYPSWRLNKLSSQSSKFSEKNLKKIINMTAEGDIKSKTSSRTLDASLDLLILTELE